MPTYISLLRYTQQGIAAMEQSPGRLDKAKEMYRKAGGETLRAFTETEYRRVIAELP
jgi:uncharacterized protein with GYD domain